MAYKIFQQYMRYDQGEEERTWVIILGSMNSGKRSTANREMAVKALAGVRSPPRKVNNPNETTVTTTGMLFSINPLHCKTREKVKNMKKIALKWSPCIPSTFIDRPKSNLQIICPSRTTKI